MSLGITGAGMVTMMTSILESNQGQLTTLGEELSSGQKSQTLSGYGENAQQLLNLNSSIAAANAYVGSATTVSTDLSAYNDALGELVSDATQLSQGITSLTDNSSGTSAASFSALVSGLATDATTTLNTQSGTRYLFAGTRYTTAPVDAIGSLPGLTSPTAFTAVTAPALPDYDTDYASSPGGDAAAWGSPTVTIAAGETISYGISSNNPAIQQLVYSLQNAQAATTASEPDRTQYLNLAQNAAQQALSGLQSLQAGNAANISQVNTVQTAQKQSVSTLTNMLDGIQGVDTTQLSAQISSLQTQMEASYKVTSSLLSLSLVNYLGSTTG
ncbi:MAG: hypothetical protein JO267_12480 [Alphaproteobacteria bacterium]|nr:hypothetical protein [Alphaproteobacteria bacterium]